MFISKNWRDITRPKALEVDGDSLTDTYGKFVGEPFERGFGITIGNSLRRILLSSLQGAAITALHVEGALHEFTHLPDVVEDLTDLILNLKEVRLRLDSHDPQSLRIDKAGPGDVLVSDLEVTHNVEVLNPNHRIATLSDGGRLKMEMTARTGRGYVPADRLALPNLPVGWIPIDALFSPIKRVNYTVTNARVGQQTDFDKLTLEVWTDGAVKPADAVAFAAKILKEQLQIFVNFQEEEEPPWEELRRDEQPFNENLLKRVDELELSVRSANCLAQAGIKYIGELVQRSEAEMLKTKNFGRKSLKEIKEILSDMGLSLDMALDHWPPPQLGDLDGDSAEA
jgi:DNA-directed RNA polymerase subunit alpha